MSTSQRRHGSDGASSIISNGSRNSSVRSDVVPIVKLDLIRSNSNGIVEKHGKRPIKRNSSAEDADDSRNDGSGGSGSNKKSSNRSSEGIAGLISGELYFRLSRFQDAEKEQSASNPVGAASKTVAVSSCSRVLPPRITAWLDASDPSNMAAAEERGRTAHAHAQRLRKTMASVRQKRIAMLKQERAAGEILCSLVARQGHDASYAAASALKDAIASLDARLAGLTLRFAALLEVERGVVMSRLIEEARLCNLERRHQHFVRRLGLYALHLEHETSGSVTMKRLPVTHPQYLRCKRAATENIKKSYFDGTSYKGVTVLDVYKIENRVLLGEFMAAANKVSTAHTDAEHAAHTDKSKQASSHKIKGLFCRVPRRCVERVVVYGMHGFDHQRHGVAALSESDHKRHAYSSNGSSSDVRFHEASPLNNVFQDSWFSVDDSNDILGSEHQPQQQKQAHSMGKSGQGYAARLVRESLSVRFPRAFSRYSTLNEDLSVLSGEQPALPGDESVAPRHGGGGEPKPDGPDAAVQPEVTGSKVAETLAQRRRRRQAAIDHAAEGGEDEYAMVNESETKDGKPTSSVLNNALANRYSGAKPRPGNGIRFLALCRVLISKIFVTEGGGKGGGASGSGAAEAAAVEARAMSSMSRDDGADSGGGAVNFDSIYTPSEEEYRLLAPSHVLPEFIVQFRFTPRDNETATEASINDAPKDKGSAAPASSSSSSSPSRSSRSSSPASTPERPKLSHESSPDQNGMLNLSVPFVELPSFYVHDEDDQEAMRGLEGAETNVENVRKAMVDSPRRAKTAADAAHGGSDGREGREGEGDGKLTPRRLLTPRSRATAMSPSQSQRLVTPPSLRKRPNLGAADASSVEAKERPRRGLQLSSTKSGKQVIVRGQRSTILDVGNSSSIISSSSRAQVSSSALSQPGQLVLPAAPSPFVLDRLVCAAVADARLAAGTSAVIGAAGSPLALSTKDKQQRGVPPLPPPPPDNLSSRSSQGDNEVGLMNRSKERSAWRGASHPKNNKSCVFLGERLLDSHEAAVQRAAATAAANALLLDPTGSMTPSAGAAASSSSSLSPRSLFAKQTHPNGLESDLSSGSSNTGANKIFDVQRQNVQSQQRSLCTAAEHAFGLFWERHDLIRGQENDLLGALNHLHHQQKRGSSINGSPEKNGKMASSVLSITARSAALLGRNSQDPSEVPSGASSSPMKHTQSAASTDPPTYRQQEQEQSHRDDAKASPNPFKAPSNASSSSSSSYAVSLRSSMNRPGSAKSSHGSSTGGGGGGGSAHGKQAQRHQQAVLSGRGQSDQSANANSSNTAAAASSSTGKGERSYERVRRRTNTVAGAGGSGAGNVAPTRKKASLRRQAAAAERARRNAALEKQGEAAQQGRGTRRAAAGGRYPSDLDSQARVRSGDE